MAGDKFKSNRDVEQNTMSQGTGSFSITTDIKQLADNYIKAASMAFKNLGAGIIMPSANVATDTKDYSDSKLSEAMNNEAMLFAGLYSLRKTGDAGALSTALAGQNKTMEDVRNMRASMKVVTDPSASRSAKLASSAFLQRGFGIDPAKDYIHINQVEMQMDALKGEIGKAFLSLGEGYQQMHQKMQMVGIKPPKTQYVTGSTLSAMNTAIEQLKDAIKESEDDKSMQGMFKAQLVEAIEKRSKLWELPFSDKESQEDNQ
jgi:hypothetical protein